MASMRSVCVFLLLSALLIISCKKEIEHQVIVPGAYFPVYPNSWWKYLVNDSMIVIDSSSTTYILHSYKPNLDSEQTEEVYVPYYHPGKNSPNFYNGPIYKYDRIASNGYVGTVRWPLLSEEVGFRFLRSAPTQYPHYNEEVVIHDKIFDGKDSILIVKGSFYYSNTPGYMPEKRYQEFFKDVGLVKDIVYDTVTNDTIRKIILIDYHIGR